jgi:hypothetical protein
MVSIPVLAAPSSPASVPLGVVLQAESATVGFDVTWGGATIYDGDRLETGGGGSLRARLGGGQMYLRPSTSTKVHSFPNGFSADLAVGTVVVSSAEGQTFQLLADGATIRPAGPQATSAQVTVVSPTLLILTATRGVLQVTLENEVKTIEAGSSYRMELGPDDGPVPQGPGSGPESNPPFTGRRHLRGFFLIFGGIATAAGIGIWRALISPSAP